MATLPLQDKVAFITGASRGIGQACAIALAKLGAHCILSARTQGGLIETDNAIRQAGSTATLFPFNLQPAHPLDKSLDTLGPSIAQQFGRLDIFIHAACHHVALTPVPHITDKEWEQNVAVNLTAGMKLIRTLSPLLCNTPNAQALFLLNHRMADPFWAPVAVFQNAMETLVTCWAKEMEQLSDIKIRCVTPSPTATKLRRVFFPAEDRSHLNTPEQTAQELMTVLLNDRK